MPHSKDRTRTVARTNGGTIQVAAARCVSISRWKSLTLFDLFSFSIAQETLIENLNAQLARKDPVYRTEVFEILTREEVNREIHALQVEAEECKKRYRDAEKKLGEKDDEISTLQKNSS